MNIQEKEQNIFLEDIRKLSQKELIFEIKKEITSEFQKYIDKNGISYIVEFYSIARQRQLLEQIKKKLNQNEQKEIEEYYNNNYYKILKEQEKIYKLNEIYLQNKQEELKEPNKEEEKRQKRLKRAKTFLQIMGHILAYIILFFTFILYSYIAKPKKKKRR